MRAETSQTTIAAIATGTGGGVGIVRVSGPHAEEIGRRLCGPCPDTLESHHLYVGAVRDGQGAPLDRVLFCLMRGPRSYTGEDVLEIHGHGGEQNLTRILEATLGAGAVLAGPGDFTRRAFLAGKLDLTQAEGLAATIGAQSREALRQAQRHLGGELGRCLDALRREVGELLGTLEGLLDFPEADAQDRAALRASLQRVLGQTARLADSYGAGGRALHQGLRVVLVGKANAGKSSLVNALCGSERILVHQEPGTTRDYVEVRTSFGGHAVVLVDTAGLRTQRSELEEQGWRLSQQQRAQADLIWLVVDGAKGLEPEEDQQLASMLGETPSLCVWNKVDQRSCRPPRTTRPTVPCSALCGWGLDELRQQTLAMVTQEQGPEELIVMSARQADLLAQATSCLTTAHRGLEAEQPLDLVAADLRQAAATLGEISGEHTRPDVLDAIFSRFCVGK